MEYTNQLKKYVRSLHLHKFRQKYDKFIGEGPKICAEFLRGNHEVTHVFHTKEWLDSDAASLADSDRMILVKDKELTQLSTLKSPNQVLCVIDIPPPMPAAPAQDKWYIYLDKIQDPGNMGTIIRIADWYGIETVLLSPDCVSVYNPKVVQSAMGGHNRISFLLKSPKVMKSLELPLYGLMLQGEDIKNLDLLPGIIVVGNESSGINDELAAMLDKRLTITGKGGAESLNAAVACGIVCQRFVK